MFLLVLIVVPTLVFSVVVLAGRHFLLAEDPFDDDDDDGYDPYDDDDDYPDDDEYYATLKNQYANSDWLLEQLAELERWKRESLASKAELPSPRWRWRDRCLFRSERQRHRRDHSHYPFRERPAHNAAVAVFNDSRHATGFTNWRRAANGKRYSRCGPHANR